MRLTVVKHLSLKSVLSKIQKELKNKDEVRERVQRDMRRATRLSKQAILFTHQERFRDARKLLDDANRLFVNLSKIAKTYPDMVYTGMVEAAFEEYAESQTLLGLVEEDRFVSPEELSVPSVAYVLGLGDVIGELRRRALGMLRKGDMRAAEKCLGIMENIYIELISMDDAYMLVPGLRRKGDVARHVIEATRGDITLEVRRTSLERSIKRLEKALKSQGKS